MKKTLVYGIMFALALSACRGIKVDVPDNDAAKATQAVVEEWMAAYQAYDSEGLLSLYAENITWMDYGYNDGPYQKVVLKGAVHEWFASEALKVEVKSFLVTLDGHFAVVNAIYSEKNGLTGKWNSTQAVAILEFKDGKIVNETWYYNTSVFYQY